MKRNPDFILREVAETRLLVPVGAAAVKFAGMVTVNDTSAYLWELLAGEQTPETLTAALIARYDIDEETARRDVERVISSLTEIGAILYN